MTMYNSYELLEALQGGPLRLSGGRHGGAIIHPMSEGWDHYGLNLVEWTDTAGVVWAREWTATPVIQLRHFVALGCQPDRPIPRLDEATERARWDAICNAMVGPAS
jgi:hypothetical protein